MSDDPLGYRATRCNFLCKYLRTILQQMSIFFCTVYTVRFFPLILADNLEEGEKSSLSRSIFETEFHSFMWNMNTALPNPVYFYYQHLHASLRYCMDKFSALCKDVRRKNCGEAHGHSHTCFSGTQPLAKKITTSRP